MFDNIYRKKSDDELKSIVINKNYSDDSILCALNILKERQIFLDNFDEIEQELIAKRNNRVVAEVSQERYSTGFDRFIALIIDGFILGIVGLFFKFYSEVESLLLAGIISLIHLALPYLYNIVLHGYCGQTFGKMAMGVKIYDKSEKKLISYKQALIRDIVPLSLLVIIQLLTQFVVTNSWGIFVYISFVMTFILLSWSILEIITMLFDSKKRAIHDFIAGTVVLKVNS
jgi:uncharacterized RDD family membrane protein YckC